MNQNKELLLTAAGAIVAIVVIVILLQGQSTGALAGTQKIGYARSDPLRVTSTPCIAINCERGQSVAVPVGIDYDGGVLCKCPRHVNFVYKVSPVRKQ